MAQDIRDLLKNNTTEKSMQMSEGHEARFLEKLNTELPQKTKVRPLFTFMNIAASIVILFGITYITINSWPSDDPTENSNTTVESTTPNIKNLGDVVPDLKQVEDYYLASINLELSKVKLTPDTKELFDGYINRLKELNDEYDNLLKELNTNGPNEATLDALINNLKIRLNLVMQLKEKLSEFSNEDFKEESI